MSKKKKSNVDDSMEMLLTGLQSGLEKKGVKGTTIHTIENGKSVDITKDQSLREKYKALEEKKPTVKATVKRKK